MLPTFWPGTVKSWSLAITVIIKQLSQSVNFRDAGRWILLLPDRVRLAVSHCFPVGLNKSAADSCFIFSTQTWEGYWPHLTLSKKSNLRQIAVPVITIIRDLQPLTQLVLLPLSWHTCWSGAHFNSCSPYNLVTSALSHRIFKNSCIETVRQ